MTEYRVRSEDDVIKITMSLEQFAKQMGFSEVDQAMIVTASSEIIRNICFYAKTGVFKYDKISQKGREGLEMIAIDEGPGIADIEQAMTDEFSTHGTLGIGLPGSKRLMDEMSVENNQPTGLIVRMVKWLPTN